MNENEETSVLFVDDEADILAFFKALFRGKVDRIYTESNPLRALELVTKTQIDVVVTDLKMPEMDGITLFDRIKAVRPEIVGVFVTGHGEKEAVQAALGLGAMAFIDKPFDNQTILSCVDRAIERSHYERVIRDVLSLFIMHYSKLDLDTWPQLSVEGREKSLRAALGLAKMQILRSKATARKDRAANSA